MNDNYTRGDIYWVDFGTGEGNEYCGIRPAVIIQNNIGNKHSNTLIVAPLTATMKKRDMVTHCVIDSNKFLSENSMVLLEQIRTIDKSRIKGYIGAMSYVEMINIDMAILNSLGLNYLFNCKEGGY